MNWYVLTCPGEDTPNMSGENHSFQLSAASIWAKLCADVPWNCMLGPPLPISAHTCSCWKSKPVQPTHYCNYSLHACNWYTSVMASLKRQPEKKDALLMRRRGPCSEKARRGLQSWENPAQHKHKHGKEEREEEGEETKKTWSMVNE